MSTSAGTASVTAPPRKAKNQTIKAKTATATRATMAVEELLEESDIG